MAAALGMERLTNIRTLIKEHRTELEALGDLHERRANSSDPLGRGRPSTAFYLNEEQATYLTIHAKTAKAKEVKLQIVRVFTAWRRGQLQPVQPALPDFTDPIAAAEAGAAFRIDQPIAFSWKFALAGNYPAH